jgi:hypothetical protein
MIRGFVLLVIATTCVAEEPSADALAHARWQKTYVDIARSIAMRRGEQRLILLDQPLRFYTNPVRTTDQHGSIFLWTDKGRPAAIGSIWSAVNRQNPDVRFVTHEWLSLSIDPLITATRGEKRLWTSGEPGLSWMPLTDAPSPAMSRSQRLAQMRAIVRRYSASIQIEGESDLRLMPQPLYRYSEQTEGALDGAIFDFAMTTDPELLVLLEVSEAEDKPAWQIAFARFGNKGMTVKEGERPVWSCDAGAPGFSDGK